MKKTLNLVVQEIKKKGIQLSHQRLKILEYLINHLNHPTAQEIYCSLIKEMPTLSKTTIYNTLDLLEEHQIIKKISIENQEAHYDFIYQDHGHFKCNVCQKIFDFKISVDAQPIQELQGFSITKQSVYFQGTCISCLKV